jgi:hypothetical protein
VGLSTDDLARNARITKAYRDMYMSKRAIFKWSGMAAFASHEVGEGLRIARMLEQNLLDLLFRSVAAVSASELRDALAAGNNVVFNDIYWQHIAFLEQGLVDLENAHRDGWLERRPLQAWLLINAGLERSSVELVWEGNQLLLLHEQAFVLDESTYAPHPKLWSALSSSVLVRLLGGFRSPIPGHGVSFQEMMGSGGILDLGNFDSRWRWIREQLLPAWRALDGSEDEIIGHLKSLD